MISVCDVKLPCGLLHTDSTKRNAVILEYSIPTIVQAWGETRLLEIAVKSSPENCAPWPRGPPDRILFALDSHHNRDCALQHHAAEVTEFLFSLLLQARWLPLHLVRLTIWRACLGRFSTSCTSSHPRPSRSLGACCQIWV